MTTQLLRSSIVPRQTETHGIALRWAAGWNEIRTYTEIERAPDSSSTPGTPDTANSEVVFRGRPGVSDWIDWLPDDGQRRHYRARHTNPGATASSWTAWVSATPTAIHPDHTEPRDPAAVTASTIVTTDGADRLLPRNPVIAADASGNTLLEDGDAVVFAGFTNPPRFWPLPQGVSVWESTLTGGSNTSLRLELENVTSSGADVVAKLQQPGATTNRDDGFSGSAITTVGGTTDSDILFAYLPALNNTFTVRGSVQFTNNSTKFLGSGQVTIKIYSYDGTTTTYTLRDTFTVTVGEIATSDSETENWARTVVAPDIDGGGSDRFRIEVSANGSSAYVSFSVSGKSSAGYTTNGVAWQTATVTEVAATSAARGSYVSFLLMDRDTE